MKRVNSPVCIPCSDTSTNAIAIISAAAWPISCMASSPAPLVSWWASS